jgi:8-oxo-dGTP pyrophosphatase MutT (NUDIX family)
LPKRERAGVVCIQNDTLLSIELEDPLTRERYWSFPGGAIEAGETREAAAVRETLEETGFSVALTSECYTNHYQFEWGGERYDCTTHWFLAELLSSLPAQVFDADYNIRAAWLPQSMATEHFGYNEGLRDALRHFFPEVTGFAP